MTIDEDIARPSRCESCRFWDNSTSMLDDVDTGRCVIRAPVADAIRPPAALWPYTEALDWCGEYQAQPEPLTRCEDCGLMVPREHCRESICKRPTTEKFS